MIYNFSVLPKTITENEICSNENLQNSGFWDLTGSPIFIDDDDPAHNWAITAATNEWCSGSGIWTDPYLIENVTINGLGSNNCIEIRDSNAYFIIQNCTLYNTDNDDYGIFLSNVNNSKLIDNNFLDCEEGAIRLEYGYNNTLSGNNYSVYTSVWVGNGIELVECDNNTLSGNIFYNRWIGIHLDNSNNNTISGNFANIDHFVGIRLDHSHNNTLSGNNVHDNMNGISLHYSEDNILSENNVSLITGWAIGLSYSYNNKVLGNNVSNSYTGLNIRNSNNNNLSGNTVSNNTRGIYSESSSNNNTFTGNIINNNTKGITFFDCQNATLSGNLMYFCGIDISGSLEMMTSHRIDTTNLVNSKPVYYYVNERELGASNFTNAGQIILINCNKSTIAGFDLSDCTVGILLGFSHNNTLSGNTVNNNIDGIELLFCHNNTLTGNTANNNGVNFHDGGFQLFYSNNNTLSGNTVNDNINGIRVLYSDDNMLYDNSIQNNEEYGIYIYNGTQNLSFQNYFINNTIHAYDNGINNYWNNSVIGNYWDNYTGVDANDDGIGDTPYDLLPIGGSVDNFPIWYDEDNLAPTIIINLPTMNDKFGFSAPNFNISLSDESPINTTWYTIDGGLTNYTFSGLTGYINETAWGQEEDGVITIRFYANDSLGNLGFKDINITKDITAPKITINSPIPNELFGTTAPSFSITIEELHPSIKMYSLNGRPNITFTTDTQISQSEWDYIGNGTVSIMFYAIDLAGNINSSEVLVRKDIYVPEITILSPVEDKFYDNLAPAFIVNIQDANLDKMWYTLNFGTQEVLFTSNNTIDQGLWDALPDGIITLTFFANDTVGNINFSSVDVIKDTLIPVIVIYLPLEDGIFGSSSPDFNISITEENLVSTWYTLDGGITNYTFSGTIGTIGQDTWNIALEGEINITFYAQDIVGNIGIESVTIIKRIPSPPSIPGYNIYLIFSSLFIALIITLEEKHRIIS
ncbi:MAG: right-handed parallel beta-helix repeat-containing protein [Candidatus Lokiarchaeota archaeon]|nr:right-handed parallel beta-helix repeat-containing protein [Candidatus Lokiarchaeota archaeon]